MYSNQLSAIREKFLSVQPILGATTTLPEGFDLDSALSFLDSDSESEDMGFHLAAAFSWEGSPQGLAYWNRVYNSLPQVDYAAVNQITIWAISALFDELTSGK